MAKKTKAQKKRPPKKAKPPETKAQTTVKDVCYTFLAQGAEGVASIAPSRLVLKRAVLVLRKDEKDTTALEEYARKRFGTFATETSRGRSAPRAGEERDYTVQKLNNGKPCFLRLQLDVLGVEKKNKVRVKFSPDWVLIMRKDEKRAFRVVAE